MSQLIYFLQRQCILSKRPLFCYKMFSQIKIKVMQRYSLRNLILSVSTVISPIVLDSSLFTLRSSLRKATNGNSQKSCIKMVIAKGCQRLIQSFVLLCDSFPCILLVGNFFHRGTIKCMLIQQIDNIL